jgi:predicted nucleic acid-binding protein
VNTHLLDSSILILALRSQPAALDLLDRFRSREEASISVVSRTEVLAGMRPHEERATAELLLALLSLPVNAAIADRAARLICSLARSGQQLSFPDALIAATALEHDLTLVTTNARHFPVGGLEVREFPAG